MKRIYISILLLVSACCSVFAGDFDMILAKAESKGVVLPEGTRITGIIVGDYNSRNMTESTQISWRKVSKTDNYKVSYLESLDGSVGLRLVFKGVYDLKIPRFSKVDLDLGGCLIVKDNKTGACTVSGLTARQIKIIEKTVDCPRKVRSISQLSSSDMYTYVEIPNVEFLSKEGSFTNIREFHAQVTYINSFMNKRGADWFDQSGLYVKDNNGDAIFLPVNTFCSWRRRGDRMPSGVGSVRGIVVKEELRRCGRPEGFQLRIAGLNDVSIPMDGNSSYQLIASWDWDRNYYYSLKCESGEKKWLERQQINCERIAPDTGEGWLGVTVPCTMGPVADYNTRCVQDGLNAGEGNRECAAIEYNSKALDWFAPSAAITIECSTASFSGRGLSVDFTWCAGNSEQKASGYPVHWKIAYSLDGRNFIPVDKSFLLCPIQWDKDGDVCYDATLGLTENTVLLPAMLLGKERVYFCIFPSDRIAARIPANPEADFCSGRPDEASMFALRLGKVIVSALK